MTPEAYQGTRLEQGFLNKELSPFTENGLLNCLEKANKSIGRIEELYQHAQAQVEANPGIAPMQNLREHIEADRRILAEISGDLQKVKEAFSKLQGKIFVVIPEVAAEIERRRLEDIGAREGRRVIVTSPGPDRPIGTSSLRRGVL